jgi:hypothetical protein
MTTAGQSSQNFPALIRELRAALPDKELTTAVVSHGESRMALPEPFALFNFVNIMTYDRPDHGTAERLRLKTVVSALKDHPGIWMWNLGSRRRRRRRGLD